MFDSLNSSRFSRVLRAAGLAVTIASLAAACGSTTDTPDGVALPDLTNVTELSPVPTDTTALIAEVESEMSGTDNTPVEESPLQQSDPPQPSGSNPQPVPEPGQTPHPQPDSAPSSEGADVAAETPAATESEPAASADEPAGQTDPQPGEESQSTSTQPPTQPDTPAPDKTTTPTPTDPATSDLPTADSPPSPLGTTDVLEIPAGAPVGSARIPDGCYNCDCGPWGCQEAELDYKSCVDSAGREYPNGSVVTVDAYGPGGSPNVFECEDGKWVQIAWGTDRLDDTPLEDPPDEGPEIELDQADLDPPTDVFEAPVSS